MSYSIEDIAKISSIFDNLLYLGSQSSTHHDILVKHNIQHVISIGCNPLERNIRIFKYEIEDNGDTKNVDDFFNAIMPEIHTIINESIHLKQPILVHCQAGISRSASVIISWLMVYKNMTYEDAYTYVKERRPVISPNITFVEYMKTLKN
jgi:protein-tyrosine phosphatase